MQLGGEVTQSMCTVQTAVETRDAARATVEALHAQERQLRRIDGQYDEVWFQWASTYEHIVSFEGTV